MELPRLGQLLIRQGWASSAEVERAANTQSVSGARLGTALLESGVLSEDILLKALSELHKVPGVGVEDLRDVPEDVVATLPARIARRCKAVPFRAFGTQVHVAMLDPRDLNSQDELAFALGKRLRPFVASEVRLAEALERYYGQPMDPHLETLAERLDRERYRRSTKVPRPIPASTHTGARTRRIWEEPEAALFSDEQTRPNMMPAAPSQPEASSTATAPAIAAGRAAQPVRRRRTAPRPVSVSLTEEERQQLEVAGPFLDDIAPPRVEDLVDEREPELEEARPPEDEGEATRPIPAEAPPIPLSFPEMEGRLLQSETPEEVGELLAGFLGQQFERVALFKVLRDRVTGWKAAGPSIDAEKLPAFSTDFSGPSIFLNLRSAGSFYLGPLPPMAAHRTLARTWGGPLPRECLVLPVRIRGRLVTVIYLDRGAGKLGKLDLDSLLHLAVVTGEAYERCILRKKKD